MRVRVRLFFCFTMTLLLMPTRLPSVDQVRGRQMHGQNDAPDS